MSRHHEYTRRRSSKEPRPSIAILVEGKVTEVEYLKTLRDVLGIPRQLVSVSKAEHSDANGIVGEAKDLLYPKKNGRKLLSDDKPDEVWVVSDTENEHENGSPQNIARAINRAGGNIYLVLDSPSIEYWFLLHYIYTTRCYENADVVIKDFRQWLPDYSKQKHSQDWKELIDRTSVALRHSARVRKYREGSNSKLPIADIDILVVRLKSFGKRELPDGDCEQQRNKKQFIPTLTCEDLFSRKCLRGEN